MSLTKEDSALWQNLIFSRKAYFYVHGESNVYILSCNLSHIILHMRIITHSFLREYGRLSDVIFNCDFVTCDQVYKTKPDLISYKY